MCALAEEWGLPPDPALLDTLLRLDSEAARCSRRKREAPGARDLMRLFNRGAVQTLLAHSTGVQLNLSHVPGAALEAALLPRQAPGRPGGDRGGHGRSGYTLALFGPEQAFGTAEKYGMRLAEVTISLLAPSCRSRIPGNDSRHRAPDAPRQAVSLPPGQAICWRAGVRARSRPAW